MLNKKSSFFLFSFCCLFVMKFVVRCCKSFKFVRSAFASRNVLPPTLFFPSFSYRFSSLLSSLLFSSLLISYSLFPSSYFSSTFLSSLLFFPLLFSSLLYSFYWIGLTNDTHTRTYLPLVHVHALLYCRSGLMPHTAPGKS